MASLRATITPRLVLFAAASSILRVSGETFDVEPGGLQSALDKVQPGDTIRLAAGEYWETVVTKTDGTADAYITIEGESYDSILKGDGDIDNDGRILDVEHSYYRLDRFTIDGKHDDRNYVDKCLYVQQNRDNEDLAPEIEFNGHSFRSSINGLVISNMNIGNCGGECVRLRYFITYAQVYNTRVTNCGVHDFVLEGTAKNGEGIYVGTSSNQWADGKNPSDEPDQSQYNHFFKNYFDTQGNEGIDIKEGSTHNLVEDNYCTGQKDPESACLDARGDGNIFRYNTIEHNVGAAIRFGGHDIDGHVYGVENEAYDNLMVDNAYAAIKLMVSPQGFICKNNIVGDSEHIKGNGGEGVDPTADCSAPAFDIYQDGGGFARMESDGGSIDSSSDSSSDSDESESVDDDDDFNYDSDDNGEDSDPGDSGAVDADGETDNEPEVTGSIEVNDREKLPSIDHLIYTEFQTPTM